MNKEVREVLKKHGFSQDEINEAAKMEDVGNVAGLGANPNPADGMVDEPVEDLDPNQDAQADDAVDAQLNDLLAQVDSLADNVDDLEDLAQALADAQGSDDELNDLQNTDNLLQEPEESPAEDMELARPESHNESEESDKAMANDQILPDMKDIKLLPQGTEGADINPGDTEGPADKGMQAPAKGQETLKDAEPQPVEEEEEKDDLDKELGHLDLTDKKDDECMKEEADPENDSKDENPTKVADSGKADGQETLKDAESPETPKQDPELHLNPENEDDEDDDKFDFDDLKDAKKECEDVQDLDKEKDPLMGWEEKDEEDIPMLPGQDKEDIEDDKDKDIVNPANEEDEEPEQPDGAVKAEEPDKDENPAEPKSESKLGKLLRRK